MCTTNYEHKMMLLQNFPIVNTRLQRQQYSTFVWYFTVFRIRVFFPDPDRTFFSDFGSAENPEKSGSGPIKNVLKLLEQVEKNVFHI